MEGFHVTFRTENFVHSSDLVLGAPPLNFTTRLRLYDNTNRLLLLQVSSLTDLYWVLPGFTGFLLGFTGFYWVLLGFTGFYLVFTGFYWVLLGFTGFCLV